MYPALLHDHLFTREGAEDPSARVRFDRIIATIVKFIKAITNMFATLAKLFGSMTVIKENNP